MDIVKVDLKNCFGIGSFDFTFDFSGATNKSYLIYAPNGTMKTSFAKTMETISKNNGELPKDNIYAERISEYRIDVDGQPINPSSILVVNSETEDLDTSNKISKFIASKDLKSKYDSIYNELNEKRKGYVTLLKEISRSTDCESELITTFKTNDKDNFFDVLEIAYKKMDDYEKLKIDFKYNTVFDKNNKVKGFLDRHKDMLDNYVSNYNELLSQSVLFRKSNNSFGTTQANELLKSTEDNSFFDAGHKLIINSNIEISSFVGLKQLLDEELEKILNEATLKKEFEKIDKAIGSNAELREFKKVIENDNSLLVQLANFDEFRKKVWVNFIQNLKTETENIIQFYQSKKEDIEKVLIEAKKESETWNLIINKFNQRFYVPFKVKLTNQEDIILKEQTASLEFEYRDTDINFIDIKERTQLFNVLSKGEKRAFFILQVLFDIESRIINGEPTLLILDDIADSFDYKNKYAIIEYINELHKREDFRLIILTHNFDFYRTVGTRLGISRSLIFMAIKDNKRKVSLEKGQYLKDIFLYYKNNIKKEKVFISIIPFFRNLLEYSDGQESSEYLLLTSCLHFKPNSSSLKCIDIINILVSKFPSVNVNNIRFENEFVITMIKSLAESISNDDQVDEINLENKIILSIAIRLLAEEYLISVLPEVSLEAIGGCQTSKLINEYRIIYPAHEDLQTFDKVALMTPENIHINSFMYEPLIDTSVYHLVSLYNEVKNLLVD
jgi:hypothetical protein